MVVTVVLNMSVEREFGESGASGRGVCSQPRVSGRFRVKSFPIFVFSKCFSSVFLVVISSSGLPLLCQW